MRTNEITQIQCEGQNSPRRFNPSIPLGDVSKEDYESTLREHQAAVDATKSAQREEAYLILHG